MMYALQLSEGVCLLEHPCCGLVRITGRCKSDGMAGFKDKRDLNRYQRTGFANSGRAAGPLGRLEGEKEKCLR